MWSQWLWPWCDCWLKCFWRSWSAQIFTHHKQSVEFLFRMEPKTNLVVERGQRSMSIWTVFNGRFCCRLLFWLFLFLQSYWCVWWCLKVLHIHWMRETTLQFIPTFPTCSSLYETLDGERELNTVNQTHIETHCPALIEWSLQFLRRIVSGVINYAFDRLIYLFIFNPEFNSEISY